MVTKGMRQVANMAAVRLAGLAECEEVAADYIRFRATGIDTVDAGMAIAEAVSAETGVCVAVVF